MGKSDEPTPDFERRLSSSRTEAVAWVERELFNLILVDVHMPVVIPPRVLGRLGYGWQS
jgi:CheY-like chemotaxis protein